MAEFLEGIGGAGVWSFWAPVAVWTGLAGLGVLVLGRVRRLHPIAGYRLRQALLLALPVSVLAAPWVPGLLPPEPAPAGPVPSVDGAVMAPTVSVGGALAADGGPGMDIALVVLGAATVAILLLAIGRLAVLATDLRQLRMLRQVAARVDDPAPRQRLRELAGQLGVRRPVKLLAGPPDSAPMTFGAWRPVILVPRALLDSPASLDAVLVHELVHIRRADYFWALLECLVSAAFAFHPLVWSLRRGIERCRETSCDAEVLARGFVRPRPYAELLARTHTPTQFPMPAVAASLSAPSLKLKERLETMKNFAHSRITSRQRVGIVLGAGLVCLVVAVAGACANRTEEEPQVLLVEPAYDLGALATLTLAPEVDRAAQERREVVYQMTRGTGANQHTYRGTEEEVLEALDQLGLEVAYLRERISKISDELGELARLENELSAEGDGEANRAELAALRQDKEETFVRSQLLHTMRRERVREFETAKMQYETQKRMREGR